MGNKPAQSTQKGTAEQPCAEKVQAEDQAILPDGILQPGDLVGDQLLHPGFTPAQVSASGPPGGADPEQRDESEEQKTFSKHGAGNVATILRFATGVLACAPDFAPQTCQGSKHRRSIAQDSHFASRDVRPINRLLPQARSDLAELPEQFHIEAKAQLLQLR